MPELAVLADDLTGGMIIASKLEAEGVACPLVTDPAAFASLPDDLEAVVLARKIRLVAPDAARAEARAAAAAFAGARTIYFKYSALFDSTDQGNIGPIAETLLEAVGARRTLFCPAYIDRGVTVYKGRLFAGATPISETSKRFDPATPAFTSDVVARLRAQTAREVGLIDHQMLASGPAAIVAMLDARAQTPLWVADAIDENDVDLLASLTRGWPLITGADSLAPAILRERLAGRDRRGAGRRLLPATPGGEVVLAGSCAEATLGQLDLFAEAYPAWRVDLARDGDDEAAADAIAAWAAEHLPRGPVAVATSAGREGVAAAQQVFGREGAALRADRLLGEVARRLRELGVRKFVVAGGETSGAVFAALGVERLDVAAYDELWGGYCQDPSASPTSFVVKPGTMGEADFFFRALGRMREAEGGSKP